MKVLRTALFSAFLMICFTNISYAQIPQDLDPIYLGEMSNISMRSIGEIVIVEYDVTTEQSSVVTNITVHGTVRHSQIVTEGVTHISTFFEVPTKTGDPTEIYVGCSICERGEYNCRQEGCIIILDGSDEFPGGGE